MEIDVKTINEKIVLEIDMILEYSKHQEKANKVHDFTNGYWDKKYSEQSISYDESEYPELPPKTEARLKDLITEWTFADDIKIWLGKCMKEENISTRMKFFIQDYMNFWDETNNKTAFFMENLEEVLNTEDKFLDAYSAVEMLNSLKTTWFTDFHNRLSETVPAGSKFAFNSDKHTDFRWSLKDKKWNDLAFVFEPNKGLTLWKAGFQDRKKEVREDFEFLTEKGFEFIDGDSNYIMINKIFEPLADAEDDHKLAWKFGHEKDAIADGLYDILNPLFQDEKVHSLFEKFSEKQFR